MGDRSYTGTIPSLELNKAGAGGSRAGIMEAPRLGPLYKGSK